MGKGNLMGELIERHRWQDPLSMTPKPSCGAFQRSRRVMASWITPGRRPRALRATAASSFTPRSGGITLYVL